MAFNQISLMGRFCKDPELRYTQSAKPVCSFTLAVDKEGKDAGADFIDCVAWEQRAEFINKYFMKGDPILVSGSLQMRDWKDKEGNPRRTAEVNVFKAYFVNSKKDREGDRGTQFTELPDDDGELPF